MMFYVCATIDWTGARSFKSCVHVPLMLRLVHNVKKKAGSGNEKRSSVVWTCPLLRELSIFS